jgi:hypothetical protein
LDFPPLERFVVGDKVEGMSCGWDIL